MEEIDVREIPGFPGYRIARDGRVWTQHYAGVSTSRIEEFRHRKWRLMKTRLRCGYPTLSLRRNGESKAFGIHTLLLTVFVCPRPAGKVARHLDGNKRNYALDNLCWGTVKENSEDAIKHGRQVHGERCHSCRLTPEDVRTIRQLLAEGKSKRSIARLYGVFHDAILKIAKGKTWRRVV